MRIEEDIKLDFRDVLIRPKRSTLSSRKEVDLQRTYTFKYSNLEWSGVPIMASNMDGVGTFEMVRALARYELFTVLKKSYTIAEHAKELNEINYNYYAISCGTSENELYKVGHILQENPTIQFICIDIANGYSEHFGDVIEEVREKFPTKTIIAGNVVTADMTQELILRGADIIKVGIGPGSVCTTRVQTGVGYPQLSAIIECADAAHGLGGHIIADGGCTCPGDVAKAFGAGADFVMLGGMLAGHDEGGGEIKDGKVTFYGMSSDTAMEKHHGGVAEYRSSEGRTVELPHRGPVKHTIQDLLGGLRSTCTYVGASCLKQLPKCTTFIRVNRQINDVFLK